MGRDHIQGSNFEFSALLFINVMAAEGLPKSQVVF